MTNSLSPIWVTAVSELGSSSGARFSQVVSASETAGHRAAATAIGIQDGFIGFPSGICPSPVTGGDGRSVSSAYFSSLVAFGV